MKKCWNVTLIGLIFSILLFAYAPVSLSEEAVTSKQTASLSDFEMTLGKSVLAPEEQTVISLSLQKQVAYKASFSAKYGTFETKNGVNIYTAPKLALSSFVDTLSVIVTVDGQTKKKEVNVLVMDDSLVGQWVRTGGPQGGTITVIDIDRNNKGVMYAAGSGNRLFKSLDNGNSWRGLKIDDSSASGKFYAVRIDSSNSNIVYAIYNGSLIITDDAGEHWKYVLDNGVTSLAINDNLPGMLIVTLYDGKVLCSTDGCNHFKNITGNLPRKHFNKCLLVSDAEIWISTTEDGNGRIYKSVDAGANWEMIELEYPELADPHSLYVDPNDPRTVYVSFKDSRNEMIRDASMSQYLQKTTDAGQTWEQLKLPSADAMIYILGESDNKTLFVSSGGTLFRSRNSGSTWEKITTNFPRNGDIVDIGFDTEDPNCIFMPTARSGILKSTDGGNTWELKVQGLDNLKTSLLATPFTQQGQTVYASSVGGEGIFKTVDFGQTWVSVMNDDTIHPWGDELQVNPNNEEEIWYIADVGNVYVTLDGGKTWRKRIDPSGAGQRFGSIYALATSSIDEDILYTVKSGFGLFKSTDGGGSWSFLDQSEVDYAYSIAINPENDDIVYSGYNPKPFQDFAILRKTENGGNTWETSLKVEGSKGITSVAIDPSDTQTVYAGSIGDDAGLWVTHDGGDHWDRLCKQLSFTNVHTMVADPKQAKVAYVGVWGGGTYKTIDSGRSWFRLANDPTDSAIAIMIDQQNTETVYLADRTTPKVYQNTKDGDAWTTYFDAGQDYYRIMAAELSQSDSSVMYVSALKKGSAFEGSLFRIENGVSTQVGNGLDRLPISITIDPADSDHIAVVAHAGGVYESKNGGKDWSSISDGCQGLPDPEKMSYNKVLFDPNESGTLYLLGGSDVVTTALQTSGVASELVETIYRSTDGGKNWENLNDGNLGENSGGVKGLCFSKVKAGFLYAGCTKGIFMSEDNGQTWMDISGTIGYRNAAGLSISADGRTVYAPMLGGGVYAGTIAVKTGKIKWADQSALAVPINHIQVLVSPKSSNVIYASAYPGGIFKSIDGGKTFSEQNFGLPSFKVEDPLRQGYYAIQQAPSNPDILYLGIYGKGIYVSKDGAGTWIAINGSDGLMASKGIYSLAVDSFHPNTVTAATEEGVFRTEDGGKSWALFSNGLPEKIQVRILVSGRDQRLYAGTLGYEIYAIDSNSNEWRQLNALGNYGVFWPIWNDRPLYQYSYLLFNQNDPDLIIIGTFPAGIFRSVDGGATFQESNIKWTFDGVFDLINHPNDDRIIYAGTYNGVNRSLDQGKTWEKWDRGWPKEQWVFSIDFDVNNPDLMYACSKNGENEGQGTDEFGGTVMKSIDGGQNWFPITKGLDCRQEFYKIIVDRFDANILYLATERDGVYISKNAGASWKPWNDGLTNKTAGVNSNNVTNTLILSPDGSLVYFGTSGDGVFRRVAESVAENRGK